MRKIRKGDEVIVISGRNKGQRGKVRVNLMGANDEAFDEPVFDCRGKDVQHFCDHLAEWFGPGNEDRAR